MIPVKKLKNIEWSFIENDTRYLTHPIHRYSSKFIPQIASTLIQNLTNENDHILDCFCGSGTTLVEANLLKRHSCGIDLNPLACLITKVKTTPIPSKILLKNVNEFLDNLHLDLSILHGNTILNLDVKTIPNEDENLNEELKRWFFPEMLRELCLINYHAEKIKNENVANLVMITISEILRKCSRASSSFPNLMIDKNRKPVKSVFTIFERQLKENIQKIIEYTEQSNAKYIPIILKQDSTDLSNLASNSFDLAICHPPYVGAVPYAEFLKLSLLWLSLDYKYYDSILIGGRRQRKDVLERFLNSMELVMMELIRVIKPGKNCAVIIGNPQVHGELIKLNELITEIGVKVGFSVKFETKRERINMRKGRVRDEFVIIFKK